MDRFRLLVGAPRDSAKETVFITGPVFLLRLVGLKGAKQFDLKAGSWVVIEATTLHWMLKLKKQDPKNMIPLEMFPIPSQQLIAG